MPFYHFPHFIVGKYRSCTSGLTELRLIDLRYRSNDRYPFVAVAHLDDDLNIVNSYTGWIFTEEKLQQKLQIGAGNE